MPPQTNAHEAVALLIAELDSATVGFLFNHFCTDTPKQIAALHELLAQGDFEALARTAHSIAGSAGIFGLQELRAAGLRLEETALTGQTAPLPPQIEAISAAYDRAVPELQKIIQP